MEKNLACVWLNLLVLALVFGQGRVQEVTSSVEYCLVAQGYSLKCYMCSTLNDPNCYDPVSSKMKSSECTMDLTSTTLQRFRTIFTGFTDFTSFFSNLNPDASFTCIKVDTVPSHAGGNSTIIRGCQFEKAPGDDICKILSVKAHGQSLLKYCGTCNTDACNGAGGIGGTLNILPMFLPVLGTLLYLRQ